MEEKTNTGAEFRPQLPGHPGRPGHPELPEHKDPVCHDDDKCGCGKTQHVTFGPCDDFKEITVQDVKLQCEGRLLKVMVDLDNVCAGKKVNIGVLVSEEESGIFKTKAFRAAELTIPGHPGTCRQNIKVGNFCFVFPEENLCSRRQFKVNVIAHYTSFTDINICAG